MKKYGLFSKSGDLIEDGFESAELAEKEKANYTSPTPEELEVKEIDDSTPVPEPEVETEDKTFTDTDSDEAKSSRYDTIIDNLKSLMSVYTSLVMNPDSYPVGMQVRDIMLKLKESGKISTTDLNDISKDFDWANSNVVKEPTPVASPSTGISEKTMSKIFSIKTDLIDEIMEIHEDPMTEGPPDFDKFYKFIKSKLSDSDDKDIWDKYPEVDMALSELSERDLRTALDIIRSSCKNPGRSLFSVIVDDKEFSLSDNEGWFIQGVTENGSGINIGPFRTKQLAEQEIMNYPQVKNPEVNLKSTPEFGQKIQEQAKLFSF